MYTDVLQMYYFFSLYTSVYFNNLVMLYFSWFMEGSGKYGLERIINADYL